MLFEWDDNKEEQNRKKHGLDFRTAAQVFRDPNRLEWYDDAHSGSEDRYITIGQIGMNTVLVVLLVVYTERGQTLRIISARRATKRERRIYDDNTEKS